MTQKAPSCEDCGGKGIIQIGHSEPVLVKCFWYDGLGHLDNLQECLHCDGSGKCWLPPIDKTIECSRCSLELQN